MPTDVVDLNSLPTKKPILSEYSSEFWATRLPRKNFMRTQIPNGIKYKDNTVVTLEEIDFRNTPTFEMLSIKRTMYKLIINYFVKRIFEFSEDDKSSIENRAKQLVDIFNIFKFTEEPRIDSEVMARYLKFHEYVYQGGHDEDLKVKLQFYVIKMIFELKANKNSETVFTGADKKELSELLKQLFAQNNYGEELNVFCQFFLKQEALSLFRQEASAATFIRSCDSTKTPRTPVTLARKSKDSWEHMIFKSKRKDGRDVPELVVDDVCKFLSGGLPKWPELPNLNTVLKSPCTYLQLGQQQTKKFQKTLLGAYFFADCFATEYARTDLMFFELACSKFSPGRVIFACQDAEIDDNVWKPNNAMLLDFMKKHEFDTPGKEDFTGEGAVPPPKKAARGLKIDSGIIKTMYEKWQQKKCTLYFMRKEKEILRMLQLQLLAWLERPFRKGLDFAIDSRLKNLTADIQSFEEMEPPTFTGATTGSMNYDIAVIPRLGKIITIDIANKFALQPIELFFSLYPEDSGKPHQTDMWKLKEINPGSPIVFNCVSDNGKEFRVNAQVLKIIPGEYEKTFVVVTGITNVNDETGEKRYQTDSKQDANTYPNDSGLILTRQLVEVEYDTDALIKTRLVEFCASIQKRLYKSDIELKVKNYLQELVRLTSLDGGKERNKLAQSLPREYQNAVKPSYDLNWLVPFYVADLKFWETETQQEGQRYPLTKFDDDFLKALDLYDVNKQAQAFLAVSKSITTLTVATDWANLWLNTFDKSNPKTKIVFPGVEPDYKRELYDEMFPIQPTFSNLELLFGSKDQFFNSGQLHLILLFEIDGTIGRPTDASPEKEFTGTTEIDKRLLPTFQQVLTANAPKEVDGMTKIPQFDSDPDGTLKSIAFNILKEKLKDKRATQEDATDFTELFTEPELTKLLGEEKLDKIKLSGDHSTKFVNSLSLFHARWNKLEPSSPARRPTDEESSADEDFSSGDFSFDEEDDDSGSGNSSADEGSIPLADTEGKAATVWADALFAAEDAAAAERDAAETAPNTAKRKRNPRSPPKTPNPKRTPNTDGDDGPATDDFDDDDSEDDDSEDEGAEDDDSEDEGADREKKAAVVSKGVPGRVIEPLMLFVCMKEKNSLDGMMSNTEVDRVRKMTKIGSQLMYDIFYSDFFNNVETDDKAAEPEPEAAEPEAAEPEEDEAKANNALFSKLRADKVFFQFFAFFKKLDSAMTDFIQTYPVQAYKYFNIMNTLISSFGLEFFLQENVVDLFPPEMDPIENSGALLWTIMFSSFFDFGIETPSYLNRESTFSSEDVSDLYEYASDKGGKHGFGEEFENDLKSFLAVANKTLLYEANFFHVMDAYYTTPAPSTDDELPGEFDGDKIIEYMRGRKKFPVSIHGESGWKFGKDPNFVIDDFRTASDEFQVKLNGLKDRLMEKQTAEYKKIFGGNSSANKDSISSIRIATLADDKPGLFELFERQESVRKAFDTLATHSFKDLEHKSKLKIRPLTEKEKKKIKRERKAQEKKEQRLESGEDVELRTSQMFTRDVFFKTEKVKRWHLGDAMWPDCTPRNLANYLELTSPQSTASVPRKVLDDFISMGLGNAPLGKIIASEILFYLSRGPVDGVFKTFKYLVKDNHYELHPYNASDREPKSFKLKGYGNQSLLWDNDQACYILGKEVYVSKLNGNKTIKEADLVRFGATPDIGLFFAQEKWERLQQSGQNFGKTDTKYRMQQMEEMDHEIRELFAKGRSFKDPDVQKLQEEVLKIQQKLKISNEFMFLLCDPVMEKFSSLVDRDNLREQIFAQALLLSKRFEEETPILSSVDFEDDLEMGVVPYNKYTHFDVAQNSMFHAVNEIFEFFKAPPQTLRKEYEKLQQFLEAFGVLFDEYEYTETEFEGNDKLFKDRLNLAMNLTDGRIFRETAKMQVFQRRYKLLEKEFKKCVITTEPDEEQIYGFEEDPIQVINQIVEGFYEDLDTIALCAEIEKTSRLRLVNFTPEALDNSYHDILRLVSGGGPLLRTAIAAYSKFKQMKMIYVKDVLYRDYPKFRHIFDTKEVISVSILKVARKCFGLSDKGKEEFRKSIAQYSRVAKEMIVFQKKTVAYKKELEDALKHNSYDYDTRTNLDNVKLAWTNFQLHPSRLSEQAFELLEPEVGTTTDEVYERALQLSFFETTKMVQFLEMNNPKESEEEFGFGAPLTEEGFGFGDGGSAQELRRSPTPSPQKGAASPGGASGAKHEKNAEEIAIKFSLQQTNTKNALAYYREKNIGKLEELEDQLGLIDLKAIFKRLDIEFGDKSSTKEELFEELKDRCWEDYHTATESRFLV